MVTIGVAEIRLLVAGQKKGLLQAAVLETAKDVELNRYAVTVASILIALAAL
jgi:hypothetical protein